MPTILCPRCHICGEQSTVELTVDEFAAMNAGLHIQNALPDRNADFRELLITGTHSECWDAMFADDEEGE